MRFTKLPFGNRPTALSAWVWLMANAAALVFLIGAWAFLQRFIGDGVDAHAYWMTRHTLGYEVAGQQDAYLYAPAFAQVLRPVTLLPWPAFYAIWTAILMAALVYVAGPILASFLLVLHPFGAEVVIGNIHLLLAAVMVASFRHPAVWSVVLLTKVTPGIGVLWYVIRREWRPLATAAAVTFAIVVVSFALDPGAWRAWLGVLLNSSSVPASNALPISLAVRFPIALVVVILGATRGWRWAVIAAAYLALPVIWTDDGRWFMVLIALIPLIRDRLAAEWRSRRAVPRTRQPQAPDRVAKELARR
jgi:hypothetical protein